MNQNSNQDELIKR